jgi:ammonia channel protein AmtB
VLAGENVCISASAHACIVAALLSVSDVQAALATLFAGAVGGLTAMILCKPSQRTWRATSTVSKVVVGVLAGLVASTSTCSVVPLWAHSITSAIAAICAKLTCQLLSHAGIDDVSAVVPVHLVGGIISVLSVGFFAHPDLLRLLPQLPSVAATHASAGLVFGGKGHQLALQLVWILLILAWSTVLTVPTCVTLRSLGLLRNDTRSTIKGEQLIQSGIDTACLVTSNHCGPAA